MFKNFKKVIIGISGGVDSSVSAYLLQKQGYYVEGLFMKNWEEKEDKEYCVAARDFADALEVCNKLNIKLHNVNFAKEYWSKVFQNFLDEYKAGFTPNPDILCNKEIKFKVFLNFATRHLGADYIATGHYVRRDNLNGKSQLLTGLDSNKDQSYFLYTLSYKQIERSLFPVGSLKKANVRKIAKELELVTANKKDSTGICFIGKRKFKEFISQYLPNKPGKILTTEGNEIGKHPGLIYFTIGQRKGLGIGGSRYTSKKDPWYVVDKDTKNDTLIVAQGRDHPSLISRSFIVHRLHWVNREPFKNKIRCKVRTRYRQNLVSCTITAVNESQIRIDLDNPVIAVTPGQSAVLYMGEICLGGGIIKKRLS